MKLSYPQETLSLADITPHDWILYLEGCLFRIKGPWTNGKFKWGRVDTIDAKSSSLLITGEDGKEYTARIKDVEFNFNFPSSGVYNYKNSSLFFSRLHARQWRKGISDATYSVQDVFRRFYKWPLANPALKRELGNDLAQDFEYTPKLASQLFDSPFPGFESAYASVKSHRALARAISPDIFLSIGAKDSRPLVWYSTIPIGVALSPNDIEVQIPEFEQELLDSFRDLKEKRVSITLKGGKDESID